MLQDIRKQLERWRSVIKMGIKLGAFGYGLGAILGVGAVILAALGKDNWNYFLYAAIGVFIFSTIIKKL